MSLRPLARLRAAIALIAAVSLCALAPARAASYTVAVVPQLAPAEVYARWTPLLERLAALTGLQFTLVAYKSIPNFEQAFTQGTPDFAYLNPYHVVMAHDSRGYIPLVHDAHSLSGILVVRRDAGIHDLRQLDGRTVAFPAPNAFGASLYMRALLHEQHVDVRPEYIGSHDNVYRAVARGDVVAGGGVAETLAREPAGLQQALTVLFSTPATAPHALAAAPRVPEADRIKVRDALLAMEHDSQGEALLSAAGIPHPVAADYRRDYLPLARLHLEGYVVRPSN